MGIGATLELFRSAERIAVEAQAAGPVATAARMSPLSPWATSGGLFHLGWDPVGMFGLDADGGQPYGPVTPRDLMRCAPFVKGRAILQGLIASQPLQQVSIDPETDDETPVPQAKAPTWLYRTDTAISPQQRTANMLDDHLYYDSTVLVFRRGERQTGMRFGPILDAVHVPYSWWTIDDGQLLINDTPVTIEQAVWIPGPSQGLCIEAQDEARQWRAIQRNIGRRLSTPAPSVILEDPDYSQAVDADIDELVAKMARARRSPDGAIMYAANLKPTIVPNNDDAALFIGARNALRIDFANHLNLPTTSLDGSPATASLTYATKTGAMAEISLMTLDYWTTPIARALSQDAITPRGTRIRFDLDQILGNSAGPSTAVEPVGEELPATSQPQVVPPAAPPAMPTPQEV